jgi:nucleoid-associated protein YgaU
MSVGTISCPCGYGNDLAAETAICPICGTDQQPLRTLVQTIAAVRTRLIWTAAVMFCAGILVATMVSGATRALSQRHPQPVARSYAPKPEMTTPTPLVSPTPPPVAQGGTVRHVVKAGDSWWKISTIHYGKGVFWPYAAQITGNQQAMTLTPGQVIELHPICIVPK